METLNDTGLADRNKHANRLAIMPFLSVLWSHFILCVHACTPTGSTDLISKHHLDELEPLKHQLYGLKATATGSLKATHLNLLLGMTGRCFFTMQNVAFVHQVSMLSLYLF